MYLLLGLNGPFVAVAKRIALWLAAGLNPDIIDSPTIDADRSNPLTGHFGAKPKACFDTLTNAVDVPSQTMSLNDRTVRKAMNKLQPWGLIVPGQQGDTATLTSQINGN